MFDFCNDRRVEPDGQGYTLPTNGVGPDWKVSKVGTRWLAAPVDGEAPGVWADTADLAIYAVIGEPEAR